MFKTGDKLTFSGGDKITDIFDQQFYLPKTSNISLGREKIYYLMPNKLPQIENNRTKNSQTAISLIRDAGVDLVMTGDLESNALKSIGVESGLGSNIDFLTVPHHNSNKDPQQPYFIKNAFANGNKDMPPSIAVLPTDRDKEKDTFNKGVLPLSTLTPLSSKPHLYGGTSDGRPFYTFSTKSLDPIGFYRFSRMKDGKVKIGDNNGHAITYSLAGKFNEDALKRIVKRSHYSKKTEDLLNLFHPDKIAFVLENGTKDLKNAPITNGVWIPPDTLKGPVKNIINNYINDKTDLTTKLTNNPSLKGININNLEENKTYGFNFNAIKDLNQQRLLKNLSSSSLSKLYHTAKRENGGYRLKSENVYSVKKILSKNSITGLKKETEDALLNPSNYTKTKDIKTKDKTHLPPELQNNREVLTYLKDLRKLTEKTREACLILFHLWLVSI